MIKEQNLVILRIKNVVIGRKNDIEKLLKN